jgi:hypothetical protein
MRIKLDRYLYFRYILLLGRSALFATCQVSLKSYKIASAMQSVKLHGTFCCPYCHQCLSLACLALSDPSHNKVTTFLLFLLYATQFSRSDVERQYIT